MAYSKLTNPSIDKRAPNLPWEQAAPGLYDNEQAVKLDTGELVAISVDSAWLENGSGVDLKGNARFIDETGQTVIVEGSKHIEANFSANVSIQDVEQFGLEALMKEVALIILGEPLTLFRTDPVEAGEPPIPVINIPDYVHLQANMRKSIAVTKAIRATTLKL